MRYWNDWPVRLRCGHFFGGVFWYGLETIHPITALAAAATSPEYDADLAGAPADEMRQVALKGLRYLCFTHDTGPDDCVRPEKSWGQTEMASTKWGERGRGFFAESQCGRTVAGLATTAALIQDLLGDEERDMLARIAADYLRRFADINPKSGVYYDTQTEENGWTALGLIGGLTLLPNHKNHDRWWELAKRWLFRTATAPQDNQDQTVFADGHTVAQLCGKTFTLLPDTTAENHAVVHPIYMAAAITLAGDATKLLRLFNQTPPPHLYWRRREIYRILKTWCDDTGAFHSVQGMDWPYVSFYPWHCLCHAVENLELRDPDAALLERRELSTVEQASAAHDGRMLPDETTRHCTGPQDPALMRELMIGYLAGPYIGHRLMGPGQTPTSANDFENNTRGVYLYPHGGVLVHRHHHGLTSIAWRNQIMVLPVTRQGLKLIYPAFGSMLARITVKDKATSTKTVQLRVREGADRAAVLLIQDLTEGRLRRKVFFASIPNGKCIVAERLIARQRITVERVEQGYLGVTNDGYYGDHPDRRGRRRLFWARCERTVHGYPTTSENDNVEIDLGDTRWVNVDERCGLVFEATGRTVYCNRHYAEIWSAIKDDLILGLQDTPREFDAGETVAAMVSLWCPEKTHDETAKQALVIHQATDSLIAAGIDNYLCTYNFTRYPQDLPIPPNSGEYPQKTTGVSVSADADSTSIIRVQGLEPLILKRGDMGCR